jgi:HEAT repeat protein
MVVPFGTTATVPLLTLLPQSRYKSKIIKTLGEIGDNNACRPITELLQDSDKELRQVAADALKKLGWGKSPPERIMLAQAEGNYEAIKTETDPAAYDTLIELLRDGNDGERLAATFALGKLKNAQAIHPLTMALNDSNYAVRLEVAKVLASMGVTPEVTADTEKGMGRPPLPEGITEPIPPMAFATSADIAQGPGVGADHFRAAINHWNGGRYEEAAPLYIAALDKGLNPAYEAGSRGNLGQIYLKRGTIVDAVDQFKKVLYLRPLEPDILNDAAVRLSAIYKELGMHGDAAKATAVAIATQGRGSSSLSSDAIKRVTDAVRRVYSL